MADARQARRLFDLGILSLGIPVDGREVTPEPGTALQAFQRATEWDPRLADAWLGRAACGDRQPAVILHLYQSRDSIGDEQRRLGLPPRTLAGRFDTGLYIDYPLADSVEAAAAYAASLVAGGDYGGAEEVLDLAAAQSSQTPSPICDYIRATIHFTTQRWPDVLRILANRDTWDDPYMRTCVEVMAGSSCAQLGMFAEAIRRLEAAEQGPIPAAAAAAMFTHGLALREQGHEDAAVALFEKVYSLEPSFTANATALRDSGFRLVITTAEQIAARGDRWDPASIADAADPASTQQSMSSELLLEQATRDLDRQIGLESVKIQIKKLRSAAALAEARAKRGLSTSPRSLHIAFTGPPGTGKTTIARIIASMYCGMGLLATDRIVEASRRDFVGEHLGSTAPKTSALIDSAMDGVLFIDEAYTLIQTGLAGGDAFGREAIDTLLSRMEDDRDRLVVIIAGYDSEIDRLLAANDGLASRFSRRIRFDSYTPGELARIAEAIAATRDSALPGDTIALLEQACVPLYENCHTDQTGIQRRLIDLAGNGRFIRNVIEAAEEEREFRLSSGDIDIVDLDDQSMMRIEPVDMQAALKSVISSFNLPLVG